MREEKRTTRRRTAAKSDVRRRVEKTAVRRGHTKPDVHRRTVSRSSSAMSAASRNSEAERNKRKERRLRKKRMTAVLWVVVILVAAYLATTVFFKVSSVEVGGETRYSSEELIQGSGLSDGDNMLTLNPKQIAEHLKAAFPYLDNVEVKRRLPSSVVITVSDCVPALSVEHGGKYLLLDATGKVLEEAGAVHSDTVIVLGAKAGSMEPGETVSEKQEKLQTVLSLIDVMTQYELNGELTEIDISKAYDVRMKMGNYTVLLGNMSNVEHKIQFLKAILQEPTLPESGIIDLTDDKEARYRPAEDSITDTVVDVDAALTEEPKKENDIAEENDTTSDQTSNSDTDASVDDTSQNGQDTEQEAADQSNASEQNIDTVDTDTTQSE